MDVADVRVGQSIRVRDEIAETCQKRFKEFIAEYNDEGVGDPKYKLAVQELHAPERNTLFVNFEDFERYDQQTAQVVQEEFYRVYPYLCRGLKTYTIEKYIEEEDKQAEIGAATASSKRQEQLDELHKKEFFIGFYNISTRLKIRELTATKIGQLVKISGQIVRTHIVHPELIQGNFECLDCGAEIPEVEQQFKFTEPTICRNNVCSNRRKFKLILHKSKFVDFQKLRIQETQGELPRGSMPRSLDIIVRGADQVECVQAGDRCDFIGSLVVIPDVAQMLAANVGHVRTETAKGTQGVGDGILGLKSLGVREMTYKIAFMANSITREGSTIPAQLEEQKPSSHSSEVTPEELAKIQLMANDRKIFDNIVHSLFPSIYGNDEIKRGIVLQMFGGVAKTTKDGTALRGDINVCLVGDPSTAKSQFLKAVADFAPSRAVYTSGKASTAAGLTAAVVRDDDGGFVIEAGALMLADQGICCIDEFDKMDIKDQVAIHEAMEQQTISITKAGVKATLNARTSILAAANPIGGHYNRAKSLRNNLSFSLPIMSRFDLFFVLLDECNDIVDHAIASRIVDMHAGVDLTGSVNSVYSFDDIRKFIRFAKNFKPTLSQEAQQLLVETYKKLRLSGGATNGPATFAGSNKQIWRITVRQLESLIRLSEAYAKLTSSEEVTVEHVHEAARLLNRSIVRIEQPDVLLDEDGPDINADPNAMEEGDDDESRKKLSFEEYSRMANSFVVYLRQQEEQEREVRKSQLIQWHLQENESEIESEADLIIMKQLCDKVIDRLMKVDNVLVGLRSVEEFQEQAQQEEQGEQVIEDPILIVHPDYATDEF